ncbi:MAG: 3,4-dihydroxy-2-butanone-4-phosphate synthase [Thermoleophilaceae bacterium]
MLRSSATRAVETAATALADERMVVVLTDHAGQTKGTLVLAAERARPEAINFMVTHGRGVVCVAMADARLAALELPALPRTGPARLDSAFTVSVDLRVGTTSGVSAADRALTARALADPAGVAADFARPGHVFPLRAAPGGVLERRGCVEAAVDLATLSAVQPAAVSCAILADDGSLAQLPDLRALAGRHRFPVVSVDDLVTHRRRLDAHAARRGATGFPRSSGAPLLARR